MPVLAAPSQQAILPRLSGAASLRHELEALLAVAPVNTTPAAYRDLILNANVTGKRSASARMWVWKRIKLRYVLDPSIAEFTAFRVALDTSSDPQQRGLLCFVMLARVDRLFRELTLEQVSPRLDQAGAVIEQDSVIESVRQRVESTGSSWNENTLSMTAKRILTCLKDFGIVSGSRIRRVERVRIGPQVTLFCARLARLEGLTDRQALQSQWFRLLGLGQDEVVDLLRSAARDGLLSFRMQANVVELTLPALEAA